MLIERICLATDGSDVAVRAAQIAVFLAHTGARRIVAVSVAQPQSPSPPEPGCSAGPEGGAERALQLARAHVDTVARIARDGGVDCETVITQGASPAPEIVKTSEAYGCDLIVIGTHGPSAIDRGYANSVAQCVVAASAIPVLVLRDPREASQPEYSDEAVSWSEPAWRPVSDEAAQGCST